MAVVCRQVAVCTWWPADWRRRTSQRPWDAPGPSERTPRAAWRPVAARTRPRWPPSCTRRSTPAGGPMEPDADGYFGAYGGVWVSESLVEPVARVERAFTKARTDPAFIAELDRMNRTYGGRPTPLYHARRLSEVAGATIHLKREDLVHG